MRRSASVDLPWSICATMEKLRMFEMGIAVMNRGIASVHFPAKWNPVSRKKMLKIIDLSGFPVAKPVSLRRNTCSPGAATLFPHGKLIPLRVKTRYGMAMTEALSLPATSHGRLRSMMRRGAAWLAASASDDKASLRLVAGFVALHVVLWTVILTVLKTAQDVHFDVAEAYAWGQKFLLGYGKHPPLSGWVAGVWFMVFPAADWATYALAMA